MRRKKPKTSRCTGDRRKWNGNNKRLCVVCAQRVDEIGSTRFFFSFLTDVFASHFFWETFARLTSIWRRWRRWWWCVAVCALFCWRCTANSVVLVRVSDFHCTCVCARECVRCASVSRRWIDVTIHKLKTTFLQLYFDSTLLLLIERTREIRTQSMCNCGQHWIVFNRPHVLPTASADVWRWRRHENDKFWPFGVRAAQHNVRA